MVKVDVDESIKNTIRDIDNLTKEIYRLEGSLRLLQNLKAGGVQDIDLDDAKLRDAQAKSPQPPKQLKEETS